MNDVRTKLLQVVLVAVVGVGTTACSSPGDGTILIGVEDAGKSGPVLAPPVMASHDAGATPSPPATSGPAPAPPPSSAPPSSAPPAAADAGSTITPPPPAPTSPFDQFQQRNLTDINNYRATLGIAPLVLDQSLSVFAGAGSDELSQDHSPHAHFIGASNAGSIWSSGFNSSAGENQGDPNGWTVLSSDPVTNELDQVDAIQQSMFDEGPGTGEAHGHYTNMMDATFTKLGVGLLEVDGSLYLTNDFSN